MLNMNKTAKILIVMAILLFAVSPSIAERANSNQLSDIGQADRSFGSITCYLGWLFPGQPIEFCGWMQPDGSFIMYHSYFIYQQKQMIEECTVAGDTTSTYSGQ